MYNVHVGPYNSYTLSEPLHAIFTA